MLSNYESEIFGGIVKFLGQLQVRVQCLGTNELVENFKLVPRLVNEGPRPKSDKLRLNLHGTYFGGKINWFEPKNGAKRRAPNLENHESGQGPMYSPTQGFNLLQISPNRFLGNWTLDPLLKWALVSQVYCGQTQWMFGR